jgi:hypothetical protein
LNVAGSLPYILTYHARFNTFWTLKGVSTLFFYKANFPVSLFDISLYKYYRIQKLNLKNLYCARFLFHKHVENLYFEWLQKCTIGTHFCFLTDTFSLYYWCSFVCTVKPVFNGTWIKRKPVLYEQILWSREYSTKIHIK